jgi:hypothetical protein
MISVYKLNNKVCIPKKKDLLLIGTHGIYNDTRLITFGSGGVERYDGQVYNGWNMSVFDKIHGKVTIKGSQYISLKVYLMVIHLINPLECSGHCHKGDMFQGNDIVDDFNKNVYRNEKCIGIISKEENELNIITESNKMYTYKFNSDIIKCIESKGVKILKDLTVNKKI